MSDETFYTRRDFMGASALALGTTAPKLTVEGKLPSLKGATRWLNSEPLTPDGLRGKVVLVDFWTYTCINWLRTLPYVRTWADKYREQGLVVVGVHTPEFAFEKEFELVQRQVKEMRVDYPVAMDNDYAVWRAFRNEYWPALYFVDAQGRIRHHQFGEGKYEESERVIQQLLAEAGSTVREAVSAVDGRGVEAVADWGNLRSGENYTGYARTQGFVSRGGAVPDRRHAYSAPPKLRLNEWAVSGDWTMTQQSAAANQAGARIIYRFQARDLHLVMGAKGRGDSLRFRVTVDGQAPGESHGLDVDSAGNGMVSEPRLYQLVRQAERVVERQFEIEFSGPGVEAFAFTFG